MATALGTLEAKAKRQKRGRAGGASGHERGRADADRFRNEYGSSESGGERPAWMGSFRNEGDDQAGKEEPERKERTLLHVPYLDAGQTQGHACVKVTRALALKASAPVISRRAPLLCCSHFCKGPRTTIGRGKGGGVSSGREGRGGGGVGLIDAGRAKSSPLKKKEGQWKKRKKVKRRMQRVLSFKACWLLQMQRLSI